MKLEELKVIQELGVLKERKKDDVVFQYTFTLKLNEGVTNASETSER